MSTLVHTPQFEGPLSLLLYLIRKEEMDIFDIEISLITKQYLDIIKTLQELDLESAGDFVSMAATLIQIKSRMCLPVYSEDGEVLESEDPRAELVQRLLEFERYQKASETLNETHLLGREVFALQKKRVSEIRPEKVSIVVDSDNALHELIRFYWAVQKRAEKFLLRVPNKLKSVAERVSELKALLKVSIQVPLPSLYRREEKGELLMTFLSLLELAKLGAVRLFQADTYSTLYVEATQALGSVQFSQLENYERPSKVEEMNHEPA